MGPVVVLSVMAVVVGLLVWFVLMYNGLVRGRLRSREAWSGIDVQLHRRAELVPNLIETVKGYAAHEQSVFDEVSRARSSLVQAPDPATAAGADGELTKALGRLFAIAEAYPRLRASENFKALQEELATIEEKVAYARQFYNRNVLDFNARIETFPSSIAASMFNFQPLQFFDTPEANRTAPVVSFTPPQQEQSA